jgi:hypothetical protein
MHEPSDGIAEELERQLQLALAAAAVAARRASAARQHAIERAQHQSARTADRVRAQIEAERRLAAACAQAVFDPGWWETAGPRDVADMWQHATSWRELDGAASTPTIFDRAAGRIRREVLDRTGLDVTQLLALAAVQELEREHHATTGDRDPARHTADLEAARRDSATPRAFDDPQRREELRERLAAASVPEAAIDARTLADVGQARQAAEAAQTPAAAAPRPRTAAAHSAGRELQRQR